MYWFLYFDIVLRAQDEEFWDNDLLYDGVEELEIPDEDNDEEEERTPSPPPVQKKKEKRKKKKTVSKLWFFTYYR